MDGNGWLRVDAAGDHLHSDTPYDAADRIQSLEEKLVKLRAALTGVKNCAWENRQEASAVNPVALLNEAVHIAEQALKGS